MWRETNNERKNRELMHRRTHGEAADTVREMPSAAKSENYMIFKTTTFEQRDFLRICRGCSAPDTLFSGTSNVDAVSD